MTARPARLGRPWRRAGCRPLCAGRRRASSHVRECHRRDRVAVASDRQTDGRPLHPPSRAAAHSSERCGSIPRSCRGFQDDVLFSTETMLGCSTLPISLPHGWPAKAAPNRSTSRKPIPPSRSVGRAIIVSRGPLSFTSIEIAAWSPPPWDTRCINSIRSPDSKISNMFG